MAIPFSKVTDWASENTRTVKLIVVTALLAGVYLMFFSGAFQRYEMIIVHRYNSQRNMLVFNLDNSYQIKKLQVVPLNEDGTIGDPLWALEPGQPENAEAEEELEAVDTLVYGRRIKGMRPTTVGRPPQLEPGIAYRLVVVVPKGRAEYDFTLPTGRQAAGGN
jgi:hypothetical protein